MVCTTRHQNVGTTFGGQKQGSFSRPQVMRLRFNVLLVEVADLGALHLLGGDQEG